MGAEGASMKKKATESTEKKPKGSRVKSPYKVNHPASLPTSEPSDAVLQENPEVSQTLSGTSHWVKKLVGAVGLATAAATGTGVFPVPASAAASTAASVVKPSEGPTMIADTTGASAFQVASKQTTAAGVCQVVVAFPSILDDAQISRLISEAGGTKAKPQWRFSWGASSLTLTFSLAGVAAVALRSSKDILVQMLKNRAARKIVVKYDGKEISITGSDDIDLVLNKLERLEGPKILTPDQYQAGQKRGSG
jgi:hypothetical protein